MSKDHWAVIPNGYAEESFAEIEGSLDQHRRNGRPLHLLHSGVLYPTADRDPSAFFEALARLRVSGQLTPKLVRVTLRASGFEERYRTQIQAHGLDDMVQLAPPIPYRDALAEMMKADGLLIFQGYTSNPAVPAKLYEYLRAKRPIFALVDAEGDTAATLREAGTGTIVPLELSDKIADELISFLESVRAGTAPVASDPVVRKYAREARAVDLAKLLDTVVAEHLPRPGAQAL
jgi:glycosyltransferase involved in cell wall biosynthesis